MVFMPGERVYNEMRAETASVWFIPATGEPDFAVLIKMRTSSIKALIAGRPLEFLFAKINGVLCNGARILDIPDSPSTISCVQRHAEEHEALEKVLNERRFPIILFNELDAPIAWADASIAYPDVNRVMQRIGVPQDWYVGEFTAEASLLLDQFQSATDHVEDHGLLEPPIEVLPVSIDAWNVVQVQYFGNNDSFAIDVADKDEGEMFECAVWASLESVFPSTLYKGSNKTRGKKTKEFTDVFSHYDNGTFLIQAKDISIFESRYDSDLEDRVQSLQKQVKKAIKQLVGAAKALKRGNVIHDARGNEIVLDRTKRPHCIALVTEMFNVGDWKEIEAKLLQAIADTGAYFNLLDLSQFISFLKAASGKAERLDYILLKRHQRFLESPNVHMQTQIVTVLTEA